MQRSRLLAAVAAGVALVSTSRAGLGPGTRFHRHQRLQVAPHRPVELHGTSLRRSGHSEPVQDHLRRRRGGRHLEVARTTASPGGPLFDDKDVVVDGHARHRAERHEHRLGRHRRAELAQHDRAGRRRLQVDERRRALDVHGPARDAAHRPHPDRSAQRQRRVRRGARSGVEGGRRARSLQDDRRRHDVEADQGAARTTRPARSTSRSIRRIPTSSTSSMWERYRTPYSLQSAAASARVSSSRPTPARRGRRSRAAAIPKVRRAASVSRSRAAIRRSSTRSPKRRRSTPGPVTFQRNPPANGLYRSTDGGKTWTHMNNIDTRPFYYSQVRVDPKNPDRVYFSSTRAAGLERRRQDEDERRAERARRRPRPSGSTRTIRERWFLGERRRHRDHVRQGRQLLVSDEPAARPVLRRELRLRRSVQHLLRRAGQRRVVRTEQASQHADRTTTSGSRSRAATVSTPRRIRRTRTWCGARARTPAFSRRTSRPASAAA